MQKEDKYLVKLGKNLLEQNIKEESVISSTITESSSENQESVYLDTIKLSKLVSEAKERGEPTFQQKQQIIKYISDLISDLYETTNEPSLQISSGPTILNAYRVVTYSLLFVEGKNGLNSSLSSGSQEIEAIKQKYNEIKDNFDEDSFESSPNIADISSLENQRDELKKELRESRKENQSYYRLANLLKARYNLPAYETTENLIKAIEKDQENTSMNLESSDKSEVEYFKQENKSLQKQLDSVNKRNDDLLNQIEGLRSQLEEIAEPNTDNAKIFVLETDLQASKIKFNELEDSYKKKKEKNRNLRMIINQLKEECKTKQMQHEALQMKYDKLQVDVDDLQAKLQVASSQAIIAANNNTKNEENQKLNEALLSLAEQLELVTKDLSAENEAKNRLVELVNKQTCALAGAEKQVANAKKESEDKEGRLKKLQSKLDEAKNNNEKTDNENEKLIRELYQYTSANIAKGDIQNQMLLILSENKDAAKRIIDIFNLLNRQEKEIVEEQPQSEEGMKAENKRLMLYVKNLVHFIDQVANSSDIQEWFVESKQTAEIRPNLITEVARVESFLKSNNLDTNEQKLCDSYARFPSFIQKLMDEGEMSEPETIEELLAINEQFALANSILIKFSNELQQRGQIIVSDMKSMKNELSKANEITEQRIEEVTNELEDRLQEVQYERDDANSKLNRIKAELRKNGNDSNSNIKCLNIINDKVNTDYNNEEEEDNNNEAYISALEQKIEKLVSKLEKTNNKNETVVNGLNQQLEDLAEEFDSYKEDAEAKQAELNDENQKALKQVDELLENKEIIEKEFANVNEENKQLHSMLDEQTEQINGFSKIRDNEKAELQNEYKEKMEEQENIYKGQIDEMNEALNMRNESMKEQIYQIKQNAKEEIKRINNELEIQTKRANEIRGNYESILSDLRNKLNEARQNETNARDELLKVTSDAKDIKSQLTTTRVDNKMLKMKIAAAEEKLKREKSLIDTQFRVKMLHMETENQSNIEKLKQDFISSQHAFLVTICEKFKDFVDFSKSISEETVGAMLDDVARIIDKSSSRASDMEKFFYEINQIRNILKLEQTASIVKPIAEMAKKNAEFEADQTQLKADKAEIARTLKKMRKLSNSLASLKEWDEWARRLYGIMTDNFVSVKNTNEIRFALEEALMNSIGQRQIWRRIDILRTEKEILASGMVKPNQVSQQNPTFTSILAIVISLLRVQKSAGHMKCPISIPKLEKNPATQNDEQSVTPKKKWPILNSI